MKLWRLFAAGSLVAALTGCGTTTRPGAIGIERQQLLLVSSEVVERSALASYADQHNKAKAAGRLIESGPEYERLRKIGGRLIRETTIFRDDTKQWKWNLTLIDAPVLNATCMPGGKITFYTGLMRQLALTDDEIAAVMGHEIAHALREHGREKVSEALGQQFLIAAAAASSRNPQQTALLASQVSKVLIELPNSREKEIEADKIGLELMARAGYDPSGAISIWEKMASKGGRSVEFLSTHPSHATRISEIRTLLPIVRPLYNSAPKP